MRGASFAASASLRISGTRYLPEEISSFLHLPADTSWKIGDSLRDGATPKREHAWVIKSHPEKSARVEAHLDVLLKRLEGVENKVHNLIPDCEVVLLCSAHTDSPLTVDFDPHVIDVLALLGSKLGLDIYNLPIEEPKQINGGEQPTYQKVRTFLWRLEGLANASPADKERFWRPRRLAQAFRRQIWERPTFADVPQLPEDSELDEQVRHLLLGVSPKKIEYPSIHHFLVWCSILTNTRLITSFEHSTLAQLSRLRAGLTIDYYLQTASREEVEAV